MYKYLILIILTLSQGALACNPVLRIKAGEKSPCEGYIFSIDKELETRLKLEELKTSKVVSDSKDKIINLKDIQISLLERQVTIWQDQSNDLSKQLVEKENSSFWKQTAYFMLGAALTTGLAFAVNQSTK
jgi:hypothetical protein